MPEGLAPGGRAVSAASRKWSAGSLCGTARPKADPGEAGRVDLEPRGLDADKGRPRHADATGAGNGPSRPPERRRRSGPCRLGAHPLRARAVTVPQEQPLGMAGVLRRPKEFKHRCVLGCITRQRWPPLSVHPLSASIGQRVLGQCRHTPKGSLQYIGDLPATFEDLGASGLPVHRRFCNKCGSPIVSEAEATPTLDWLKSGTLDDRSWLQPQVSVWCDSAQPWVKLPDAMPKFPTSPPAA
jgi:hypothetical protein